MTVKRTTLALLLLPTLTASKLWAQSELKPESIGSASLLGTLPPLEPGDGRRTLGRFVPNLGRSLAGVLSPHNASSLALGASLAGVGTLVDRPTQNFFSSRPRAEEFGEIGQSVGGVKFIAPLALGLFAAGRASHDTRFRAASYDLGQAMLVTQAYATGLKMTVGRTRPDGSNRLSFPSGHTASAFTFATIADHYYGRRAGAAAYAAAGLIGLSRMERNKHHVSDVLAGAALGWISARTVIHQNGDPLRDRRQLSLVPVSAPSGSGVGLGFSLGFEP